MKKNINTLTLSHLKSISDPQAIIDYWEKIGSPSKITDFIKKCLMSEDSNVVRYGARLIPQCLSSENCYLYAIHAADQVLLICRKRNPNDYESFKIIEEIKVKLKKDMESNKDCVKKGTETYTIASFTAENYAQAAVDVVCNFVMFDGYTDYPSPAAAEIEMRKKILAYGMTLFNE